MRERVGIMTMKGNPLTLVGNEVKVGEGAPDFVALDPNLTPIKLSSYRDKICIISSIPSLDTPVCDIETRKFNEEPIKLGEKIQILTISMDLPFAQKRWCGAAPVNKIQTLSDHREAQFDIAYGVQRIAIVGKSRFSCGSEGYSSI
jgi:thiol peroxidase